VIRGTLAAGPRVTDMEAGGELDYSVLDTSEWSARHFGRTDAERGIDSPCWLLRSSQDRT
jgi:hypothetical protein